jgi:biopolymer transport protein ExbB
MLLAAAAGTKETAERSVTLLTMIKDSGWNGILFMSLLGLFSLATVAIILERLVSLSRRKVVPPQFVRELQDLLGRDSEETVPLRELCQRYPAPAANVLKAGLVRAGRPVQEVEKMMEDALAREAAALRSRVRPLSVAANVAPLIGLLGTVIGIIMAFQTASRTGLGNRGEVMAEGISLALLATAGGLSIAIPALLFAAFFHSRIDRLLREIDDCLQEVVPRLAGREPTAVNGPLPREHGVPVGADAP